jgi:hypothetical protein
MSQENVELTRAYFEEIACASRDEFDTEATISKMAEFFDPEIEWDTSGGPVLEIAGVYRGSRVRVGGAESGSLLGKHSTSNMSWSMPENGWKPPSALRRNIPMPE